MVSLNVTSPWGEVTGVLWSPPSAPDRAPLVLMGHGGGQHSKAPAMAGRRTAYGARRAGGRRDAAGQGGGRADRPDRRPVQRPPGKAGRAGMAGQPGRSAGPARDRCRRADRLLGPEHGHRDRRAADGGRTQDHRRGLRSVLARFPGRGGKPGHHSDRVRPAVGRRAHRRRSGLALFDAFASKEKTLHANAGKHKELPRFEADGRGDEDGAGHEWITSGRRSGWRTVRPSGRCSPGPAWPGHGPGHRRMAGRRSWAGDGHVADGPDRAGIQRARLRPSGFR